MGVADYYRESMPRPLQYDLAMQEHQQLSNLSLTELLDALERYAEQREDTDRILRLDNSSQSGYNPRNLTTMMTTGRGGKTPSRPCIFCEGMHFMSNRTVVTDPKIRFQIFQQKKLCTICTSPNHTFRECKSTKRCWGKNGTKCDKAHHVSLHDFFANLRPRQSGPRNNPQQQQGNGQNRRNDGQSQGPQNGPQ